MLNRVNRRVNAINPAALIRMEAGLPEGGRNDSPFARTWNKLRTDNVNCT